MSKITSANDIELVVERGSRKSTTTSGSSMGRMVVDEFSLSREQGSDHVPSVGEETAAGYYEGVSVWSFSFTMMGEDIDTYEVVTKDNGASQEFSFTARKVVDGSTEWEESLASCTVTSEEKSASADDAMEYSVEGIGYQYDREL